MYSPIVHQSYSFRLDAPTYLTTLLICLQVNMGNIYFKMGQYAKAIKYYKMAVDQVGLTRQC